MRAMRAGRRIGWVRKFPGCEALSKPRLVAWTAVLVGCGTFSGCGGPAALAPQKSVGNGITVSITPSVASLDPGEWKFCGHRRRESQQFSCLDLTAGWVDLCVTADC